MATLTVLGAYGGKLGNYNNSCFLINDNTIIDAGNILSPLKEKAFLIENVFLTHSHLDHIVEIPFLIDVSFSQREKPINIYALKETLKDIKKHILNDHIWPDFGNIKLISKNTNTVQYRQIIPYNEYKIDEITLKPIPSNHIVPTVGYVINDKIYISGDTINSNELVNIVNSTSVEKVFIDVSFPDRLESIAKISKHHCPKTLKEEIEKFKREVDIYIYHMKPQFIEEIELEIKSYGLKVKFLKEGQKFEI